MSEFSALRRVNFQGGPGSVRFGYGLGVEAFERFRFSVLALPLPKGFFCVSVQFNREGRFRFPVPGRFLSHPEFWQLGLWIGEPARSPKTPKQLK